MTRTGLRDFPPAENEEVFDGGLAKGPREADIILDGDILNPKPVQKHDLGCSM